jgi:hypothetical protein
VTHGEVSADGLAQRRRRSSRVVVLGGAVLIALLMLVKAHPPWEREEPPPLGPVVLVVDLATGDPLPSGVALRLGPSDTRRGWFATAVPGTDTLAGTPLRADAAGVIHLGTADVAAGVFVGAEGRAWRRVDADTFGRLPWTVALGPGGRVRVEVPGWRGLPHPVLALGREDGLSSLPLPAPDAEGRVLLQGIPAGRQRIEVCRGTSWDPGDGWATAEVDVPAGGETTATIDLRSFVLPTKGRFHGTVAFPAGLPVSKVELRFEGEHHEEPDGKGGSFESFAGDFLSLDVPAAGGKVPYLTGELPPGSYHLNVEFLWSRTMVLPKEGTLLDIDLIGLVTGVLRVVDGETGDLIPGSSVGRVVSLPEEGCWSEVPLPGTGNPGEFRFLGFPGFVSFSVQAPGHLGMSGSRGSSVEVPTVGSFDHEFRLARAAALEVTFRGGTPADAEEAVRFCRNGFPTGGGWSATILPVKGGRAAADKLPPGDFHLEVDPGPAFNRLPDIPITLRTGETTRIVVDLERRDPRDPTAVRGTVTFSSGWGEVVSRVTFCGMDRDNSGIEESVSLGTVVPGVPASFSMGRLPPGLYRAVVDPQWRTEVVVEKEGGAFDFRIPAPAEVLLRVVAAEDGAPLSDARLTWHSQPEEGIQGVYREETATAGPGPGEFRLLVPPGIVVASAEAAGRAPLDLTVDGEGTGPLLRSGEKLERVLRLTASGSLHVNLMCGGAAGLPPKLKVYFRKGAGPVVDGTTSWPLGQLGEGLDRKGLAPGTYTLSVLGSEGFYEPVEDRVFEINGGKQTVVTVELEKKR